MKLVLVLLGLALCTIVRSDDHEEGGTNGMPPFVFLSPPTFRAGHTVSVIYTNNLNKYVCLSVRM